MNGDVCFFRFGPPKFPRWEVVNGFFPSFCGLQNFEVRSDEFSLLVFILDQLNFEAKTSELSFLFPALWACKSSRWEPLVNWISHCLHFGRPNFSGQNEWMKFPVHFIGASEILRWKLVNSWFLHFGPPKFWGEKSWMEFPGSFTLGLQSFEAKTSELNFPVSFYFGPGWPGYFGSERQWVSCFLFPSLWAFFFALHGLPHFILKSGFLLVWKMLGSKAWSIILHHMMSYDGRGPSYDGRGPSYDGRGPSYDGFGHHIASYDVIWWVVVFVPFSVCRNLVQKNCSFQQLKAVLFFVPGPWPKGFVEKVLRQKKGQWKGNEGHQAHKGPKTNFVKEPPNLEKGRNKLLEGYV